MFEGFENSTEREDGRQDYQVLARRTRPQSFSELVGQESAVRAIEGMISQGRIPHAFLFTGTRGTGKTSSARILAKSLCCERGPTLHPCQECNHCVQITACAHEDVFEIDGASHTGVDNIRELRESARFFPQSSRYKIFIIDEVHMLSIGAFNALLKTLEEPPPQVIFILATTELHKVPITVRSRCMILSFRKIDPVTIAGHLARVLEKDSISYSSDALQLVAREAKGSLRDALSLLEQILALGQHKTISLDAARTALSVMGEGICQNLFVGILQKDAQQCLEALSEIDVSSLDYSHILDLTSQLFRSAIVLKQSGDNAAKRERANELLNLLPTELEFISRESNQASIAALIEIYRVLALASREILRINSQKAWAEVVILDCISRADWLSAEQLLGMLNHAEPRTLASSNLERPAATTSKPHKADPQPPIQKLNTTTAHDRNLIQSFSELVNLIQQKNVQLAVKLKHAKITSFTPQRLIFSDCAENKLFAQLSEQEAEIFLTAMSELGCGDCQLEGISLPKNFAQLSLTKKPNPQRGDVENKNSSPSLKPTQLGAHPPTEPRSSAQSTSEAIKNLIREDPFGSRPQKPSTQKKNEQNLTPAHLDAGMSLASIEQAEESRQWKVRQEDIKTRPIIKKLESLGAEIDVLPLKRKEHPR